MTDHATEAERFHNEYLRLRTPGRVPKLADVLALANYHATMAVADAIRGLAPNATQDATGAPHSHEQAEPGQVDGDKAAGRVQPRVTLTDQQGNDASHLFEAMVWVTASTFDQLESRAEKAEAQRDELEFRVQRADDLVAELRKHADCQTRRAERVEAERDEAAKLSHRYRNERDGILSELEVCGTHRDIRDLINRHTPEVER